MFFYMIILNINRNKFNTMAQQFTIKFFPGQHYNSDLKSYSQILQNNFCLLSWLAPNFRIKIMDAIIIDQLSKIKLFQKGNFLPKYYLLQRKSGLFIFYTIGTYEDQNKQQIKNKALKIAQKDQAVQVQFVVDYDLNHFVIQINSKNNVQSGLTFREVFLSKNNQFNEKIAVEHFSYFKSPIKIKQAKDYSIQYYYIQPEKLRHHEPEGYHLTLSFQGNGARGATYVGVNNAIRKMQHRIQNDSNENIKLPIRSLIGSSSGGLLSLAISTQLQESDLIDLCYMMDTLVVDRFVQTEHVTEYSLDQINSKYSQNIHPQFFKEQEEAVKNILQNLGLIQQGFSNIIFETLKQPSVQQKIIALFTELNPSLASILTFQQPYELGRGESIKNVCGSCCCCCYSNCWSCCGLYPCCQALPGSTCFIQKSNQYRKVNIYGLLCAALMTGDAIENTAAYALSLFLQMQANKKSKKLIDLAFKNKRFKEIQQQNIYNQIIKQSTLLRKTYKSKSNKVGNSYLDNPLMKLSKTITLRQYYELSGIEFTCTGIDLQDKIGRFFNHKTTPFLPVSKAVQITVSFPVAFLALSWKKQWGKYYIHYDNIRKEIDLQGHHFSDGGLAADFPLEFLDNQKFRPKYFSHKIVKDKTLLYGFSADKFDDFPQNDNSSKINERINDLLSQLKYRLVYKFLFYAMKCSSKQLLPVKNIKLFQFGLQLLNTLQSCDRNINIECFKYDIIHTKIHEKVEFNELQYAQIKSELSICFIELKGQIQRHFDKFDNRIIDDEFNSIYYRFSHFEQEHYKQNGSTLNKLFNKLISYQEFTQIRKKMQNTFLVYSTKCAQIYRNKMRELDNRQSLFR